VPLRLAKQRGSPNYYLRGTVRGRSIYESTGTDSQEIAEALRVKREAELLEESVYGARAVKTFAQAAEAYLKSGGSPRFLGSYDEAARKWTGLIGHFGTTRLREIGQGELDAAAEKLHPKASPETRNRQCYTPFIAVWNHAAASGWAEERTWRRPRKPKGTALRAKASRAGTTPVSYERAAAFVLAMTPAPAMVMTTLFYTGLRPIELFALEADDVRPDDRWIVVTSSKTGEPRGVPMHDLLVPMFRALKARGGHLFRSARGTPYPLTEEGGGQLSRAIDGARTRCGIRDISPYTARHTVSTQLVIAGVHPYIKDQILGHAVDSMSRRYTAVPQAPLIEAINLLPVVPAWRDAWWLADPVKYARVRTLSEPRTVDTRRRAGVKSV